MIRYTAIEASAGGVYVLGSLDSLSDFPKSDRVTTVYALKTYTFAPCEVWWNPRGTDDWHRLEPGAAMEHV